MVVTLGQQYDVEERPTVILYTCRDRTKHTMSLDYNSICNIGSRIGWVLKEIYFCSHGCGMVHTYKYSSYGVED